ncbi:MAG: hypothetical protein K8U57_33490 [Planctomycetes bacterium]|nr:hypothetical protein [Planctomycetota bacterium]
MRREEWCKGVHFTSDRESGKVSDRERQQESVEDGKWASLAPEPVIIPATYGLMNGVWFRVKQGMQGLLVHDRQDRLIVFMVSEPTTRYFQVMTRAEWMPRLIDEVI